MNTEYVEIWTDGACSGNPGPGGWGAILTWNGQEKAISGAAVDTTNNRMELLAVISGLEQLKRSVRVRVFTDSKYVQNGITQWIGRWQKNGWRTKAGQPVKNVDLWKRLSDLADGYDVDWQWVKGHAGHPLNERADALARAAITDLN
ncbi:MAG: ribonuclease HI [Myxococcota bacterium]|nr:ribonuclease HI [Myxococcota bacterium]